MIVISSTKEFEEEAIKLAFQHNFPFQSTLSDDGMLDNSLFFIRDETGWHFRFGVLGSKTSIRLNFAAGKLAHRHRYGADRRQGIGKAIGIDLRPRLKLLDMTGGYGQDAFVLAGLGCEVTLIERHPLLCALLKQALSSAMLSADESLGATLQRMTLIEANSVEWLQQNTELWDVIYLDPMFPCREKSAKVKKEMQLLHILLQGEVTDERQLIHLALERATYRVVVKRPRLAPPLGGKQPTLSLQGSASRFDIYARKSLKAS